MLDAMNAVQHLRDHGKSLFLLDLSRDLAEGDFNDQLIFFIQSLTAESERERFKERGKKSKRTIHERKKWVGPAPFGYRYTGHSSPQFEKEPSEEAATALIFQMALEGATTVDIGHRLRREGVPGRRSRVFSQPTVFSVLKNPIYAGHFYVVGEDGKRVRGELGPEVEVEPYITAEQFEHIQHRMRLRSKGTSARGGRPSSRFLCGNGLCKCSHCGSTIYVRGGEHDYYYCASRKTETPCPMPLLPRSVLDHTVRVFLSSTGLADLESAVDRAETHANAERNALEQRLSNLDRQIREADGKLDRLAAQVEDDDAVMEDMFRRTFEQQQQWNEQRDLLREQRDGLPTKFQRTDAAVALVSELRQRFIDSDCDTKALQVQLREVFARIHIMYYGAEGAPTQIRTPDVVTGVSHPEIYPGGRLASRNNVDTILSVTFEVNSEFAADYANRFPVVVADPCAVADTGTDRFTT
jgi:hypothetical protein